MNPRCLKTILLGLSFAAAVPASPLDSVNALRLAAGLPQLETDSQLGDAAQRHAAYLDLHREPGSAGQGLSAHQQQPGLQGFSGESPMARALASGYPHRGVRENVSMGYDDMPAALDGLMSAIYHRLTFLDFHADQLGQFEGSRSRVFLLGRSDLTGMCAAPADEALFRTPVDCLGEVMRRDYYESLCADLGAEALFQPSHSAACPNGQRLDAGFMQRTCEAPPEGAGFVGFGRYYQPCGNGTRIDADWFEHLCESPPAEAAYAASGNYYEICDPPRKVFAEWFEGICESLPETARYRDSGRYRQPCADQTEIRVEYLDKIDVTRLKALPSVVLWPPQDATDVPPAFFIEEPDPLPDLDVSGYPVSIQFNPAYVERPVIKAFRLWRLGDEGRTEVRKVRLLDAETDPQQLLTEHEFALFPLQRLDWGTAYQAEVEAEIDGRPFRKTWSFSTATTALPLFVIEQPHSRLFVRTGKAVRLYLPPTDADAHTVLSTRVEHLRGNRVELEVVDPNTIDVTVEAERCDRIRLQFEEGRQVELVPSGCSA